MLIYNTVTAVCLVLMALEVVWVCANLAHKDRADDIVYLRNFKKGKGFLIYIFTLPMYVMGIRYAGESIINSFFLGIRRIVDLVVLKYEVSSVELLMRDNAFYSVALYISFVLIGLNAIMVALSLISQRLWLFFRTLYFRASRKEKVYLFGANDKNVMIYDSDYRKRLFMRYSRRVKIVVDDVSPEMAQDLYMKNVPYRSAKSLGGAVKGMVKSCSRSASPVTVIINTEDENRNIEICRAFIACIREVCEKDFDFTRLRVLVIGDPKYETIYEDIVSDSYGSITYVNKYQKIAVDFIDKYPFAHFMDERHIDYDTSLVREGVDINAIMIGFGKTNQQIFLTSVANNQFIHKVRLEAEDGTVTERVAIKQVDYHIFDKDYAQNNKNLNHNYNRYKNEFSVKRKGAAATLELPDAPATEHFNHLDVNDMSFYNHIKSITESNAIGVNFVIIAFGTDLENIDMAQKLTLKFEEWGVNNVYIFVKTRMEHDKRAFLQENKNCFLIAGEKEAIYNLDDLLAGTIFKMAQMRNEIYELQYAVVENNGELSEHEADRIRACAYSNWYKRKTQTERDSNLYGCLSIRAKLNMMGLDYTKISADGDNSDALTEQEYLDIYAKDDMPELMPNITVDGKSVAVYGLSFKDSRRRNLTIHEHLRWNSYMISRGTIPATIEQIEREFSDSEGKYTNGKSYKFRRHGCLTTFDGLIKYREIVARRMLSDAILKEKGKTPKTPEEALDSADVIRYDYQLMDDAYWLLTKSGFKIVKKALAYEGVADLRIVEDVSVDPRK